MTDRVAVVVGAGGTIIPAVNVTRQSMAVMRQLRGHDYADEMIADDHRQGIRLTVGYAELGIGSALESPEQLRRLTALIQRRSVGAA